jgi:hypothetical protein
MSRIPGALVLLLCLFSAFSAQAVNNDVEGPQDSLDGPPLINHCTLRKAVINSNGVLPGIPQCHYAGPGLDTITIPAGMTITFALAGGSEEQALTGDLDITDDLIINGNGATIDGADLDRIFDVHPGVTLTLNDLHLRNGNGLGGGGAIRVNGGTLVLNNVTITSCHAAGGDGGAILADSSTMTITNATISGNTAAHIAGGIILNGGTSTVRSSTITGNSSGFANLTGGFHSGGMTTIQNTIIAGNTGADLPNLAGFFTSLGHNIVGSYGTNAAAVTFPPATGDQLQVSDALLNLGPLQNNGGPTPTHELQPGSIALDAGHSGGVTTDQRGLTRPCDNDSLANAAGGDGADVGAFEEQVLCVTPNAPPDAVDDPVSVAEDSGSNDVNVLTNDSDGDGDALTITAASPAFHGAVGIVGDHLTYTPDANYFGSDSFTYTISDGEESDTATVTVTVTNVNDAPVATGENYTMDQDTTLTVPAAGVLGNDTDIDGPSLSAVLDAGLPGLALNANGGFSYTPPLHFAGSVSFTYHASDGIDASNVVTVDIDVADTEAPVITASTSISSIWPPNSKLVDVGLTYSAVDNSSAATTSFAVFSDEDDVTPAGGQQAPDAVGALQLRADRNAQADGRVYLIRISATDAFDNTSHQCLTVVVPRSQSAADVASVNAQAAAAAAQCTGAGMFVLGD